MLMRRLSLLLLSATVTVAAGVAPPMNEVGKSPRFPAMSNEEAWRRLRGEEPPLPDWARKMVGSLPRATAAMLSLDNVHRTKNPLDPVLRGKMRWMVAVTNRCEYSRRYAEADLRRAALSETAVKRLTTNLSTLPAQDRAPLAFAEKLTRAAYTVTDKEFAELLKQHGPEKVVAMVHTVAHANFQDRLFLVLGAELEPRGPLAPMSMESQSADKSRFPAPARQARADVSKIRSLLTADQLRWSNADHGELKKSLEKQKNRGLRIPLPSLERLAKLPPEVRKRSTPVIWSRVSLGYQPELTQAWFDCMSKFREESKLDRVLANTMFWVITRSNDCFY